MLKSSQTYFATEPLNIVILGGSYAGLAVAHRILTDEFLRSIQLSPISPPHRCILISPSTDFYYNVAGPRALVSSDCRPSISSCFIPIEPAFANHPRSKFLLVQGTATAVDTTLRRITIITASQSSDEGPSDPVFSRKSVHTIPYHALIVATGSSAASPLLSLHGPYNRTLGRVRGFQKQLEAAEAIVIAGGGQVGVECAAEIASHFKPRPWWRRLSSRIAHGRRSSAHATSTPKAITLISGHSRLLPKLPERLAQDAERALRRRGVRILHDVRLVGATESFTHNRTICSLSSDATLTPDAFVNCTGRKPNTSFLPRSALDPDNRLKADRRFMRAYRLGERCFALGDCADWSKGLWDDVYVAVDVLVRNLRNDLIAHQRVLMAASEETDEKGGKGIGGSNRGSGAMNLAEALRMQPEWDTTLRDLTYTQPVAEEGTVAEDVLIPIGKTGGVGIVKGREVPGWIVWLLKGCDYGIGRAKRVVNGERPRG